MARQLYIIGIFALMLTTVGCSMDSESTTVGNQNAVEQGYGSVSIAPEVNSVLSVETRVSGMVELDDSLRPSSSDFSFTIKGSYIDLDEDDNRVYDVDLSYESIDSYNDELPLLFTNDEGYSVAVKYGDSSLEGEGLPCYAGDTTVYVVARSSVSRSIEVTLQNSLFTFATAEWFDRYYTDAEFTITTSAGAEFNFSKGVDGRFIFVEAGTTLTLSGSAIKTTGVKVNFAPNDIVVTRATVLSSIEIDASLAAEGGISVSVDGNIVETEDSDLELNEDSLK